jgi:hypothetical protein
MSKQEKRSKYEPPRARSLSDLSASGDGPVPTGMCSPGSALTFDECKAGIAPAGGECAPYGVAPEFGYCRTGHGAVEGCLSGGIHT